MLTKICGMRRQEDVAHAARLGFAICGFVFHPQSPRYIQPEMAADLDSFGMRRAGVFVRETASAINRVMRIASLDFAQLHGAQNIQCAKDVGAERIIRVLWPQRFSTLRELEKEAEKIADFCAYFLLDAGSAGGGSGMRLRWRHLADLRLPRTWFLAGGLSPDNIPDALNSCQPGGLDFNSGLEDAPGIKNREKMTRLAHLLQIKSE